MLHLTIHNFLASMINSLAHLFICVGAEYTKSHRYRALEKAVWLCQTAFTVSLFLK